MAGSPRVDIFSVCHLQRAAQRLIAGVATFIRTFPSMQHRPGMGEHRPLLLMGRLAGCVTAATAVTAGQAPKGDAAYGAPRPSCFPTLLVLRLLLRLLLLPQP